MHVRNMRLTKGTIILGVKNGSKSFGTLLSDEKLSELGAKREKGEKVVAARVVDSASYVLSSADDTFSGLLVETKADSSNPLGAPLHNKYDEDTGEVDIVSLGMMVLPDKDGNPSEIQRFSVWVTRKAEDSGNDIYSFSFESFVPDAEAAYYQLMTDKETLEGLLPLSLEWGGNTPPASKANQPFEFRTSSDAIQLTIVFLAGLGDLKPADLAFWLRR